MLAWVYVGLKRYTGRQAPDVYVQDLAHCTLERLANRKAIDTAPMWAGQVVYLDNEVGLAAMSEARASASVLLVVFTTQRAGK